MPEPAAPLSESDDDDAFFDATLKRHTRLKRGGIALGAVLAVWLLARAFSGPAQPPPLAPVITARALPAVRMQLPRPQLAEVKDDPSAEQLVAARPSASNARTARRAPAGTVTQVFAAPPPVLPQTEVIKLSARPGEKEPTATAPVQFREVPADNDVRYARPNVLLWTVPGGAAVMVNGRFVGRSPLNISWELGKETEIELALGGYKTRLMTLTPESSSGILRVELTPSSDNEMLAEDQPEPDAPATVAPTKKVAPELRVPPKDAPFPERTHHEGGLPSAPQRR